MSSRVSSSRSYGFDRASYCPAITRTVKSIDEAFQLARGRLHEVVPPARRRGGHRWQVAGAIVGFGGLALVLLPAARAQPINRERNGGARGCSTGRSGADPRSDRLAGLADKVTAKALDAMHRDVARDWTVDVLARLCGVSRSGFAARFRAVVGMAHIDYLLRRRMALAKHSLSVVAKRVGKIVFSIGCQSSSAITTAFTRAVGCSPTRFARRMSGRVDRPQKLKAADS